MNRKSVLILIGISFLANLGFAQVLDGAYAREHTPKREPVPYQHIREADAMYSKKVLRVIDLDEKINQVLYFPIIPMDYPSGLQPDRQRVSLIYLLYNIAIMNEAESQRYMVYEVDPNDLTNWYKDPVPVEDTVTRKDLVTYTEDIERLDTITGMKKWEMAKRIINMRDVKKYLLWEEWVFDKQRSLMDVRIVSMAPVARYLKISGGVEDMETDRLFWIYFPEYRPLLSEYEVFNRKNDAERKTFDDIFRKRMFNSYLLAETNVYDNRFIRDYLLGIDAMLEGKRIEEEMFQYEHDLWEY